MKIHEAKEKLRKQKLKEEESLDEITEEPVSKYRGSDAGSLTSTSFTPKTIKEKGWIKKKTTEKGYARIVTNKGNLNFVIHCDLVPLASENFFNTL